MLVLYLYIDKGKRLIALIVGCLLYITEESLIDVLSDCLHTTIALQVDVGHRYIPIKFE